MRFLLVPLAILSPALFAQQSPTDPAGGGTALIAADKLKASPAGPTPKAADGKPDLTGIWTPDRTFIYDISTSLGKGEDLPLQPWAAKLAKERMSKDDPEANCLPAGVPRMAPYPWKIVQTPTLIVFLFEGNIHTYRQVFLDGREHPKDPTPPGTATPPASGRATRWWWIPSASTTSSGSISPGIRTPKSCT
jgi:hypothetical protein